MARLAPSDLKCSSTSNHVASLVEGTPRPTLAPEESLYSGPPIRPNKRFDPTLLREREREEEEEGGGKF